MRTLAGLMVLASLVQCSRVEDPRPLAAGEQRQPVASSAAGAPPSASALSAATVPGVPSAAAVPPPALPEKTAAPVVAACLVPLTEPPPPAARPAARCPKDPEEAPVLPRGRITFLDAPSQPILDVELARDPDHRMRGLMYRTALGAQRGMLFSWGEDEIRNFWMHNTCIPLDMLFLSEDGTILGVLEQVPTLNDASRSIPCPARHVLEVNAGWSRAHGVKPGQKLQIEG